MARADLTVYEVARTGLTATYTSVTTDGAKFDNATEDIFIHIQNAASGGITITLDAVGNVEGEVITDRTVSVASGGAKFIGPFPAGIFNQNGEVYIGSSGTCDMAAVRLPVN